MSRQDLISHHVDRAFEELDLARKALSPEAATAHLALSELHLGRMKALSDEARAPHLRLVDNILPIVRWGGGPPKVVEG